MSGNGTTQSPQGEFASIARELGRGALVTVMRGPNHGARMLVRVDGTTAGSLGDAELERVAAARADELMWAERSEAHEEGDVLLFVDVVFPAPRLVIFGAIDANSPCGDGVLPLPLTARSARPRRRSRRRTAARRPMPPRRRCRSAAVAARRP